jgi:hypothetical protein
LVLQLLAIGFIYVHFHPVNTLYYKSDILIESFLRYSWQSKEALAILREELNSQQDGITIKELHQMIKLEKKEIIREQSLL